MKYPDFRLRYKSKEPQEQSAGPERELSDITVISVAIVFSAVSLSPEGPVSLLFSLNSASLQRVICGHRSLHGLSGPTTHSVWILCVTSHFGSVRELIGDEIKSTGTKLTRPVGQQN